MKKFAQIAARPHTLLILGAILLTLSYFITGLETVYKYILQVAGIILIIAGIVFASARFDRKIN